MQDGEMELFERATIAFPSPLNEEQLQAFFRTVANADFSARVEYLIKNRWAYERRDFSSPDARDRQLSPDERPELRGIEEVVGFITPSVLFVKKGAMMVSFEGYKEIGNDCYGTINGIRFSVTPGYGIRDVREGELEIMDRVRKIAESLPA